MILLNVIHVMKHAKFVLIQQQTVLSAKTIYLKMFLKIIAIVFKFALMDDMVLKIYIIKIYK